MPLLKSGLQLLGRYGIHQESISRRPEQVYLPSDLDRYIFHPDLVDIMMACGRTFDVLLLFCFFVSTFLVRKYAFSSTTCTLYGSQFLDKSQVGEVNTMLEETYIYSTLWKLNCERWYLSPRLGLRLSSRKSLILLLLLIAGDI